MPYVLGAGNDDPLYTDSSITLTVTPDADLSGANAIRCYLVDSAGNRVQWGSDQPGVGAGTEVTAVDEPDDLTLGGEPVGAGRYTVQWKYDSGDGDPDTIKERDIYLTDPAS
jgi:hypothetical protein